MLGTCATTKSLPVKCVAVEVFLPCYGFLGFINIKKLKRVCFRNKIENDLFMTKNQHEHLTRAHTYTYKKVNVNVDFVNVYSVKTVATNYRSD